MPPPLTPPPPAPIFKAGDPVVHPIDTTGAITFVVPSKGTAFEGSYACLRSAIELQPGSSPSMIFTQLSPMVGPAMSMADIDLERDITAIGGFDCDSNTCMYAALELRHPDRIPKMMEQLVPGEPVKQLAPNHWVTKMQGVAGPRSMHVRAIPIDWSGVATPADPWAQDARHATHVVFIIGINGTGDLDPLPLLASPVDARGEVARDEALLFDAHARCAIGRIGPQADFKPGFKLTEGRFALGVPKSEKTDPLMRVMQSDRTIDLEIDLAIKPVPTNPDLTRWVDEGRKWMNQTMSPVKAQFASQGPLFTTMMDVLTLVVERGFKGDIRDNAGGPKTLRLSWRTDHVPQADVDASNAKLAGAFPFH